MGCCSQKYGVGTVERVPPKTDRKQPDEPAGREASKLQRTRSGLSNLQAAVKVAPTPERKPSDTSVDSLESELEMASRRDWQQFDWRTECLGLHEGSMKTVGCLKSHPRVALASATHGTGEDIIQHEVDLLNELAANGVRTIAYCNKVLDVPSVDPDQREVRAKAYLMQYFDEASCFLFEEGEPGTEDHYLEPMRKLKLVANDEGDWAMNRDTIRILKENHLEGAFMQDLTAIVKFMLDKSVRIVDFQGVLGKDGHFYIADPLRLEPMTDKVNKYLLEGVFMSSTQPQRENKPKKAAFVEALGVDLGVSVPDTVE